MSGRHDGDEGWLPLIVMVLIIVGVLAFMAWNNNGVDTQIDDCIAQGGTPVVVSHSGFDRFKACVMEGDEP